MIRSLNICLEIHFAALKDNQKPIESLYDAPFVAHSPETLEKGPAEAILDWAPSEAEQAAAHRFLDRLTIASHDSKEIYGRFAIAWSWLNAVPDAFLMSKRFRS